MGTGTRSTTIPPDRRLATLGMPALNLPTRHQRQRHADRLQLQSDQRETPSQSGLPTLDLPQTFLNLNMSLQLRIDRRFER